MRKLEELQFSLDATVDKLPLYDCQLELSYVGKCVEQYFRADPLLPGVMLTRQGKFVGVLSRHLFLEQMSSPYGLQWFLDKPLHCLYMVHDQAIANVLIFDRDVAIVEATQQALDRSEQSRYDPMVVAVQPNVYKVLGIHQLLMAQVKIYMKRVTNP